MTTKFQTQLQTENKSQQKNYLVFGERNLCMYQQEDLQDG